MRRCQLVDAKRESYARSEPYWFWTPFRHQLAVFWNEFLPGRRDAKACAAAVQAAGPKEVSFLNNRRYASALDQTLAGAVIVHPDMAARVPARTLAIVTTEPYAAWARVAALFYPVPPVSPGIHPSAIVAEGALVDPSAEVGPLSVIEAGAEIGP